MTQALKELQDEGGMMKITYYLLIYHQRSGMVSVPFRDK
jgi:hypothetical protein